MFTDLPLDELRAFAPERIEPADFDAFWRDTLAEAQAAAEPVRLLPVETGHIHIDTYDVTFSGFAGEPIRGWLRVPKGAETAAPRPAVVEYLGYGGGRGPAFEPTLWSSLGYAHFLMDSRGQSTYYGSADTPDGAIEPQVGGIMTRGISSPKTYYYRRLFTDAVRAVETVRELPYVNAQRVATRGGSQGGALAIAAGVLGRATATVAEVPFLSEIRRSTQRVDTLPYREIREYLQYRRGDVDAAFHTLSYVDCVNFAARASQPLLVSAALMDDICPPSGAFSVFNHWLHSSKEIQVFEFNGHDGGGAHQISAQVRFLRDTIGVPA